MRLDLGLDLCLVCAVRVEVILLNVMYRKK